MNKIRHHIERATEVAGFRLGFAGAESSGEPLLFSPLPDAGPVGATQAVAGETVSALRMARGGFVPRLDLRPDVYGERQALRRGTEMSFAALAAPGIGAGQRRASTFKEEGCP